MGYGLWVMGTTSAYAREGTVEIVHWPSPVRFGTSVTPSGKVVPMKNPLHSCKYSAAAGLKGIGLPEVHLNCQVRKALGCAAPPAKCISSFITIYSESHRHIVSELNEYSMLRELRYYAIKSIKVLNYYSIDIELKYINEYSTLRY